MPALVTSKPALVVILASLICNTVAAQVNLGVLCLSTFQSFLMKIDSQC